MAQSACRRLQWLIWRTSRSHDLTFWLWAASGKCRRVLSGDVLSLEEEGDRPGGILGGQLSRGLQPRFCFCWEYFCLIECLWIAQLCFCCVAQTNRCGGRDGAGGWGCVCESAGGRPRLGHVDARAACSSPVCALRQALAAPCSRRRCELRAFLRLRLPAGFPPLPALCAAIPPRLPASRPG